MGTQIIITNADFSENAINSSTATIWYVRFLDLAIANSENGAGAYGQGTTYSSFIPHYKFNVGDKINRIRFKTSNAGTITVMRVNIPDGIENATDVSGTIVEEQQLTTSSSGIVTLSFNTDMTMAENDYIAIRKRGDTAKFYHWENTDTELCGYGIYNTRTNVLTQVATDDRDFVGFDIGYKPNN